MKKNIKAKAVKEKNYARGTGGGPPLPPNPESGGLEEKILSLIPSVTIEGDENVEESLGFFSPDDNAEMNVKLFVFFL